MAVYTPAGELALLVEDALGPLPRVSSDVVLLDRERARMAAEDTRNLERARAHAQDSSERLGRMVVRADDLDYQLYHEGERSNVLDFNNLQLRQQIIDARMITDIVRAAARVREPSETEEDLRQTLSDIRELLVDVNRALRPGRGADTRYGDIEIEEGSDIEIGWGLPPNQR